MVPFISNHDRTILLGDFNSVTNSKDRLSGHLNGISSILRDILGENGLYEPAGSHKESFTYFHPSLINRRSCLDCIYINFSSSLLRGYCSHMPCSDHYLVGLCSLPNTTRGPSQ